jgi:hypothetical protein
MPPARAPSGACPACGAAVAQDQRYCLECGERQAQRSEFLRSGPPTAAAPATPPRPPGATPPGASGEPGGQRNNTVTLLAAVGVLLLAMGVGVLIGRSGSSSGRTPAPQVITIGSSAATTTGTGNGEEAFASDWPAGKSGWTVELQTLPASSTPSQLAAAKTAASGKAKSVGALKAEEFPSVGASGIVIYSGDYRSKAKAQRALAALKGSFPGAKAVQVSSGASAGSGSTSKAPPASAGGNKPSVKSSLSKPAPLSSIKKGKHSSGKQAEEESASLPEVVETD